MMNYDNKIIAHRGESFEAPENTLASINLAWGRGVKSVEIDIRFTLDNEIVVIHDKNTHRTSGKRMEICNTSLQKLKELDVGIYKAVEWKNQKIPTLKEVLQTVPENGKLIIEIKSDERLLGKLQTELSQTGLKDSQIEIIAFDLQILSEAKKQMPQYKMLWLLGLDYTLPWWMLRINKKKIAKKVKSLNLDGINVWAGKVLNYEFISYFNEKELLVYAWTINDPIKALYLLKNGIGAITTDKAKWLTQQIFKDKSYSWKM